MRNGTTLLLGLDGVSVARVERPAAGRRRVHLVTADERARARPGCGVFATRVKGSAVTRPRDLSCEDRADAAGDLDRRGEPAHPPRPGPHRGRPPPSRPHPPEVPHLVRGLRHPRSPPARHHRRPPAARDRRFINTGHSNAKSEGISLVIKLVARNTFGFRNAENQRLRTRCVTTRGARGHLHTAHFEDPEKDGPGTPAGVPGPLSSRVPTSAAACGWTGAARAAASRPAPSARPSSGPGRCRSAGRRSSRGCWARRPAA